MTDEPIRVEVENAPAGIDLVATLARRGLGGELVHCDGHWEVEIERAEPERPLIAVLVALESWLLDRGLPEVALEVDDRRHAFRPHPDAIG